MERVMRKMMLRISKFAPMAFVVAGTLLCVDIAHAQRRCSQDPAVTGRTCPELTCIALQDDVDLKCKTPAPQACRNVFGCAERTAMRQRWVDCLGARETIHATCWIGVVDPGHEQAVTQVNISITKCDAEIAKPTTEGGCKDPCPED
jgi:hypothetical protein